MTTVEIRKTFDKFIEDIKNLKKTCINNLEELEEFKKTNKISSFTTDDFNFFKHADPTHYKYIIKHSKLKHPNENANFFENKNSESVYNLDKILSYSLDIKKELDDLSLNLFGVTRYRRQIDFLKLVDNYSKQTLENEII